MDEKPETKPMGQVIQIDEARIRDHLGEMVRGTVEEALNAPRQSGIRSGTPYGYRTGTASTYSRGLRVVSQLKLTG